MSEPTLTVAILAGGAATRLHGRDKGLELLQGRTLIDWALDVWTSQHKPESAHAVATSDIDVIIVANRNLDEYSRRARTISDAVAGFHGPLAGIAAALQACPTQRLMTVPVDCPDPPRELASKLLAAMAVNGANVAVAHDGERRQPLFAMYRRELAGSASNAVQTGQGVWQWQDSIGAIEVDFSSQRRQFHNLHTPGDFAAYADVLRSRD
jgi:molybdopterin-guanine dinucleotide biosynthesis protein A